MSNVSNLHTVEVHTDGKKPLAGQRLSVIRFKTPSDKKDDSTFVRPINVCVSIPILELQSVKPDCLKAAFDEAFQELQDAAIRKLIVDALEEGTKKNIISDDEISYEAIARYAAAMAISGKLSKSTLDVWFDENLADALTLALANALGISDKPSVAETEKLTAAINQHKKLICELASPRASMPEKLAGQLKKAVLVAEDDKIRASLVSKLDAFLKPKEVSLDIGL